MSRRCSLLAFVAAALASPFSAQGDVIEIKPGDHICDHRQHPGRPDAARRLARDVPSGRFPEHDLVIRNLGFSGDELTLRLRSAGFGTPDQWLTRTQGRRRLRLLRLQRVVRRQRRAWRPSRTTSTASSSTRLPRNTTASRPLGWSCSRRSPWSHRATATCPTAAATNERLELYTAAMAEVAKANGVAFVDLFRPDCRLATRKPPNRSRSTAST